MKIHVHIQEHSDEEKENDDIALRFPTHPSETITFHVYTLFLFSLVL